MQPEHITEMKPIVKSVGRKFVYVYDTIWIIQLEISNTGICAPLKASVRDHFYREQAF